MSECRSHEWVASVEIDVCRKCGARRTKTPPLQPHRYFKCPGTEPECIEGRCMFCEGGITYCTVCGLGEYELEETPICPGTKTPPLQPPAPEDTTALAPRTAPQ